VWPRPLKTTTSSLDALDATDEATEGEREGLRSVIWARASVLNGDGGADTTKSGTFSFMVPTRQPALTKEMGRWRSFLPASNAVVERWPDVRRASSTREKLFAPVAAVKVNKGTGEGADGGHTVPLRPGRAVGSR
jgi:hypothetical protein